MNSSEPFLKEESLDYKEVIVEKKHQKRKQRLLLAICLCFVLFVIQFVGGWISSSLALMADAFHMLSDVIGYVISLTSIILATSPKTKAYPFGKRRLEVLGALSSVLLLWLLTFGLVSEAFDRLYHPKDIDGKTMLIMAIGGVVVNALLIGIFGHDGLDEEEIPSTEDNHDLELGEIQDLQKESKNSFDQVSLDDSMLTKVEEETVKESHHTEKDINIRVRMDQTKFRLLCFMQLEICCVPLVSLSLLL
jgi:cation diffusion facilitator family transporter